MTQSSGLLAGKVAVVTGAARGIGLAVSRAFMDEGASVAMADVEAEALAEAARDLPGERLLTLGFDVTDAGATEAAARAVTERFGRLDLVVPNAGILVLRHAIDLDPEAWRRVIEVNLTGAFLTAQAFGRRLADQGSGGRIILTSSLFGLRGGVENAAYSASKFGMIGLMQCLAAELAPKGILVNCVCPGQMDTAMIRQLFAERAVLTGTDAESVRGRMEARIPLGHLGSIEELAGTYVWLASDLSRYVTGQSIVVDGGWQVG